jgi:hypothetical protein
MPSGAEGDAFNGSGEGLRGGFSVTHVEGKRSSKALEQVEAAKRQKFSLA